MAVDDERLLTLRVASSEIRADLERELADLDEGIDDGENEQLHDALASIKTVEALFDWLLGKYTPDSGTLLHSLALRSSLVPPAPTPSHDDLADGRPCELTYTIVVNVHPEDGEPDGGLPAGAPVEFYKLPDDVAETLKDLGNEYLHEVNGVEPTSIRFLD